MPRILIIADDLTGAAEIGGIATRFGLSTQLLRKPAPPPTACDCVVYDTDTRLLPTDRATAATRTFADAARAGAFDVVFKKTDSVLRGQPLAEIDIVADVFRRADVLLVPHNPSRGRSVTAGVYRVNSVPLDQTEFARDPLHPATTADVVRLLRPTAGRAIACVPPGGGTVTGVTIGEASDVVEVAGWSNRFDPARHLAAGGADFFEALCRRMVPSPPAAAKPPPLARPILFVSGTTSPATAGFRDTLAANGRLLRMPDDLFERGVEVDGGVLRWMNDARAPLQTHGVAMLTIGRSTDSTPGRAEMLGKVLAETAARVAQVGQVRTIACEGGATAAAVCDTLRWTRFTVDAELSPGIVSLMVSPGAAGLRLIVKPGSYAWPPLGI